MIKRIKVSYFPTPFIYLTPVALLLAIYLIIHSHFFAGCVIGLFGIAVLTSFYITEFDIGKGTYKDYLSVLGFVIKHEKKKFKKMSLIIIIRGSHKHTVRSRTADPYQVSWPEYTAILIHDENEELELMTKTDKRKLIQEVKSIAEYFQIDVEDRSVRVPYIVDLKRI